MSRALAGGFGAGSGPDPVWETLRDAALLLGAIGASLVLLLLLSLLPHGRPASARDHADVPAAQPGLTLAPNQVVAGVERSRPAWRVAAQE